MNWNAKVFYNYATFVGNILLKKNYSLTQNCHILKFSDREKYTAFTVKLKQSNQSNSQVFGKQLKIMHHTVEFTTTTAEIMSI